MAYGDGNRVIGDHGQIPWMGKMPADLRRVREMTSGQAVIMGLRTFEPIGRPLPNRQNIVLSRGLNLPEELGKYEDNKRMWGGGRPQTISPVIDFLVSGEVDVALSLDEAFEKVKPGRAPFIFGGASVYRQALEQNLIDTVYATEIHGEFDGDAFFPALDANNWKETKSEDFPADNKNLYPYSFVKYERKK